MTDTPDAERSTDAEQYDTDAAVAIARDQIADDLDPAGWGDHHRLDQLLAEFVADLRDGGVSDMRIADMRTHLRNLDDALDELRRLYGFADDRPDGATDDRIAEILAPLEVSRDDYGSTEIRVSDTVKTHVYDEGDPSTVTIDLDSLDGECLDGTNRLTLDAGAACDLRADLETAFTARIAERKRYDEEADE